MSSAVSGKKAGISRRNAFIESVLAGNTTLKASEDAGISRQTGYNWMGRAEVRGEIKIRQKFALDVALARVVASAPSAIGEMRRLMAESKDENIRLRAAGMLSDKAERLSQEHPAFREESAHSEPMFVLPPGTRVLQMMTTAVIPREVPTLKRSPEPMVVVDDPGEDYPPSPALPLPGPPPGSPPPADAEPLSPEELAESNLLDFKVPDGSR